MSNSLAGKIVWITGASSGIGEAVAKSFAGAGAAGVVSPSWAELERVRETLVNAQEHLIVAIDLQTAAPCQPRCRPCASASVGWISWCTMAAFPSVHAWQTPIWR